MQYIDVISEKPDTKIRENEVSDFPVSFDRDAVKERFRAAFKLAGGNQAVALRSGVPKGTINSLLAGNVPTLGRAYALAAACGVSLDWLVTGKGQMLSHAHAKLLGSQLHEQAPGKDHLVQTASIEALLREHPELAPRHFETREEAESAVSPITGSITKNIKINKSYNKKDSQNASNPLIHSSQNKDNLNSIVNQEDTRMHMLTPMTKDLLSQAVRLVRKFYGSEAFAAADPDTVAEKITEAYDILVGKPS